MGKLIIDIPDSIEYLKPHLQRVFTGMVYKLEKNKHKNPPRKCDIVNYILLLQKEILELYEQWLKNKEDDNLFFELCDVANFALLIHVSMSNENEDNENGLCSVP